MTMTPRDTPWEGSDERSDRGYADLGNAAVGREAVLSSRRRQLVAAAATSCGPCHRDNEDSHSALEGSQSLFVVADGVGGGALAAWASHELVAQLHAKLGSAAPDPDSIRAALIEADRTIGERIVALGHAAGAATVALCKGVDAAFSRWLIAWVGDCRIYRLSEGDGRVDAELVTRDDSYRNLDEQPPSGASPDDPARMVGNGAISTINVRDFDLAAGGMLVLCSDGVHKHVMPADIRRVLVEAATLAAGCRQLIDHARNGGSRDDATVMAIQRLRRDQIQPEGST